MFPPMSLKSVLIYDLCIVSMKMSLILKHGYLLFLQLYLRQDVFPLHLILFVTAFSTCFLAINIVCNLLNCFSIFTINFMTSSLSTCSGSVPSTPSSEDKSDKFYINL